LVGLAADHGACDLSAASEREAPIPFDRKQTRKLSLAPAATMSDARAHALHTSAKVFLARGYGAVTMRELAAAGGLTTGSLYHHFESKDDLVRVLLETGLRDITAQVTDAVEAANRRGATGADILRAALETHLEALLAPGSLPAANMRIFAHVPTGVRRQTMGLRRAYEAVWTQLLAALATAGVVRNDISPDALMRLVFGAMNWTVEWAKPSRDGPSEIVDDLIKLVLAPQGAPS
jgi:AcrR family transcriptional regulator